MSKVEISERARVHFQQMYSKQLYRMYYVLYQFYSPSSTRVYLGSVCDLIGSRREEQRHTN